MNAAFLILVVCAATLTVGVVDAAPPGKQSAELARLILQALEMNKANVEQSEIVSSTKVSARVQDGDEAAKNPYKDFKPPADHKLPSKDEQPQQQQFFFPGLITVSTLSGTLVTVEKVSTLEGVKLCYRDQLIGIQLPPCLPGYWYTCIFDQFPPELGETVGKKIQVCDMGPWPPGSACVMENNCPF